MKENEPLEHFSNPFSVSGQVQRAFALMTRDKVPNERGVELRCR